MDTDWLFGSQATEELDCHNCGQHQSVSSDDTRCASCGYLMNLTRVGDQPMAPLADSPAGNPKLEGHELNPLLAQGEGSGDSR